MNKEEWENLWEWLVDKGLYEDTEDISDWLEEAKVEWEKLDKCEKCGFQGIEHKSEFKHSYKIETYDYCPHCCKKYNSVNLWSNAKDEAMTRIMGGDISPKQIFGLIDAFGFKVDDFKADWLRDLINGDELEKYNMRDRMIRKIENDKNKK